MQIMSLFKWAKKDQTTVSLRELLTELGSKAGVPVTYTTALQAVTAMACARVIGEGMAQIPLKLHKDRPNGGSDPQRQHKLYKLVNDAPNDFMTSFQWRETMGLHLVFAGNSYSIIVRVKGEIVELLPVDPKCVTVKYNGWKPYYEVRLDNRPMFTVQSENMLHIRGISWDMSVGLEGIKLAKEVLGLTMAAEEHGARTFANGAQPNGVLSTDANLDDAEVRKQMRESWEMVHGGTKNTGKTALLWGGLKWASTAQQNDQAQFLETRAFQVSEVCRWARVMPIMVGHADKAMTFASAEQIFLSHVVHTMGPWYSRVEQQLNMSLLTKQERDEGYYFKFNISALMRGSHKDRADYFSKALGAGGSPAWLTQDEVRALDEYNPMGGSASELPIPNNSSGPTSSADDTSTDPSLTE